MSTKDQVTKSFHYKEETTHIVNNNQNVSTIKEKNNPYHNHLTGVKNMKNSPGIDGRYEVGNEQVNHDKQQSPVDRDNNKNKVMNVISPPKSSK